MQVLSADGFLSEAEIINGRGYFLTREGFIDSHVHVLGGGGEGGFANRTRKQLWKLTKFGVTTVVGCLGTDGIGRDICALVAKRQRIE